MRKILVTGGAGFIGSELTRQLKERGEKVIVADNLVNGKRENLADVLGDRAELCVTDICDRESVARLMDGVDIVFHLACLGVRHSIHSPLENHEVNASATLNLLIEARKKEVKRFVYVSSSEVYGTAKRTPMTEEHPTFPMTVYGASKLAGECYARAFYETYNYSTVILRPFNSYGPRCHHEGDSGEVIPKFLLRSMAGKPMIIFGDGSQTRDFTFVSDTAEGIMSAGYADGVDGQTINLGSGKEISILELSRMAKETVGRPDAQVVHDAPRPGDVLRLFAESSKARQLLGFKPKVGFREGLQKLADWYMGLGKTPEELLVSEKSRNWETVGK
jgi:UDP-glucose 4-epimerase